MIPRNQQRRILSTSSFERKVRATRNPNTEGKNIQLFTAPNPRSSIPETKEDETLPTIKKRIPEMNIGETRKKIVL